ncbi:exocyst complex component Sec10-like protein [Lipomyces chichibuensis]|uniref:exocyst complex component Sec10-like protein n=1 Tax=Lipomyces chichibuensis TaxID=1546026 RepID=UPI0033442780
MPAKSPTPTTVSSGELWVPHRPQGPRRLTSSSLPPIFAVSPDKERLLLPPVLYQAILSYLPLSQYVACAQVSRAFRQIVYDDAGWISRLRKMKVWDDAGAASFQSDEKKWTKARSIIMQDLASKNITPLNVLETVHSIPGYARHEFARVYKLLAPLYFDLTRPARASQFEPQVFKIYRTPELQTLVLRTLIQFSNALTDDDADEQRQRLYGITEIFENAAIRELETGLDAQDYEGRARRYAMVLTMLNGGNTAVQAFIQRSKLLLSTVTPGTSTCFLVDEKSGQIKVDLEPVKTFLRQLSDDILKEASIIGQVFSTKNDVIKKATLHIVERVIEDILGDYCLVLVDRSHEIDLDLYLQVVSGTYEALLQFAYSLLLEDRDTDDKALRETLRPFHLSVHAVIDRIYEQHVDLYLQEELDRFRAKCDGEVSRFDRKAAQQEQEQETILRNKYREMAILQDSSGAEKFDFLTSFKKVLFLPVVAIGSPVMHASSSSSRASSSMKDDTSEKLSTQTSATSKEPLPSTELAANAAILNSRLASIRNLFSLEVALDLIQAARESIERTALFALFDGQTGEEAKEQCQLIFTALLEFLGFHHIQNGFERALSHLTEYRPPTTTDDGGEGERPQQVEPLVTFLELVNVGDLIQQMVDVFYEKELISRKFLDRTDFLSPAVKEKRRFEQMLDEHVALGLNRGIDVLIEQVNYFLATYQRPNEFNVNNDTVTGNFVAHDSQFFDSRLGPTEAAIKVVNTVSSHTKLLNGNTDKTTLDVFLQEVGLRLYSSIGKHIKRQTIAVDGGAVLLISDLNYYYRFVETSLRQRPLLPYFAALREIAQLYLIDAKSAREIGIVMSDVVQKFAGIVTAEDVLEYVQRRADWILVKRDVEKAVYGLGLTDCLVM